MGNISIEPIVKFVLKFKVNILSLFILFLLSIVLKFEIPFLIGPESDGIILLAFFLFWGSLSPTNNTQKYYFILGFSLVEALVLINIQKIKGLDFPLTFYDLTYIGSNPMILFSSIGLSQNESIGLLLILVISIIYLVYFFYFRNKSKINIVFYILIYFLFGYVSLKGFSWINKKYSRDTYLSWKQKDAIEPFVQVNKRLGTLGFLSFSSNDSIQKSDLFSIYHIKLKNVSQPQKINRFLNDSTYHKQLPNIVFFLAESTFNPNTIFEYKAPISDNYLFREKNEFEKNQILFVSAIGGGTWKSEFEILTGLDSRAFGFLGQYTHSYLSQRLINSFPRYLSNNGYHTTAFYPVDGKFYGASFGYKNYGFKNFYDSEDLGLDETNWKTFSDFVMVQKSFKKWTSQSPFFYTYVSLKNHSPHNDCSDNNRKFDFFDTNDQNINCVMDVYLNRALDTEKAIYSIKNELEAIKKKTGRQYLMVVFGDHQPHTFVHPQFIKFRKKPINYTETFVKYIASDKKLLPNIKEGYHISMIPTILSSILTNQKDKYYFQEQLNYYNSFGRIVDFKNIPSQIELLSNYSKFINNQ